MSAFAPSRQLWAAVVLLSILISCSKSDRGPVEPGPDNGNNNIPTANDSMYFLFKDQYLWTDVIPDSATFKPNSYSSLSDMMNALKSYKKHTNGQNLDKYSFIDNGTTAGIIDGGQAGDFGLEIGYNTDTDLRVILVYEGSPAYKAGLRRSWQITAVNGNSNLAWEGEDGGDNVKRVGDAVYGSDHVTLTVKNPETGASSTVELNVATYNINPVLFSKVLSLGGRKIGYFVFNQFINLDKTQNKLDAVFDKFISDGITDLVVDFRYNGGGAVITAEYLANLIAPASVGTGKKTVMYKETFNSNLTAHKYSKYLANKKVEPGEDYTWGDVFDFYVDSATAYFNKEKSLNLSRVVFIGSRSTASASELVINVLKPFMNVKLVGETTYGKPVGFIGMPVGGFDMYAVSMQSKNAQGQGDYFDGFPPDDKPAEADQYEDYSKNWGSTDEVFLRRALLTLGVSSAEMRRAPGTENLRTLRVPNAVPDHRFKGMIETRIKFNNR
jgi:carboxyl-terminal processing protease